MRRGVSERRVVIKRLWGNSDSVGILYSDYTVYPDMDPGLAGSKKNTYTYICTIYVYLKIFITYKILQFF